MKEETLKREYIENGLTGTQIAEKYNVSASKIYYFLKKYKIELRPRYQNYKEVLTKEEEEFLFGKILGDGYLKPNSFARNSNFSFAHNDRYKEYTEYCYNFIKRWCYNPPIYREQKKDPKIYKNNIIKKYVVETISHPEFSRLRRYFYEHGRKIVNKDILENLTPLSLAIWYQDDGSLEVQKNKTNGMRLHTSQFPLESVNLICNYLKDVYGIKCNPVKSQKGKDGLQQYCIRISKKSTVDFSNLIKPYTHSSMNYKLVDGIV